MTVATPSPRSRSTGFTHESTAAATVEWYTPAWVFDALKLTFDLDVCSPGADKTVVPANQHYTPVEDGLMSPWFGTVWCNPPYGRETATWLRRLADHDDGIALVFARPDTVWFQEAVASATIVCFIAGRIKFIDGRTGEAAKGSPGAGSALIAYGERAARAVRDCGLGVCVTPMRFDQTD